MKNRIRTYISRWLNDDNKPRKNLIEKVLFFTYSIYKKIDRFLARTDNRIIAKAYIRIKNVERNQRGKNTFISLDELILWTNEWIKTFPQTYDVIVGIPRSGLLVANIIALRLGKPLSTPELFKDGHYWLSIHVNNRTDKKEGLCRVLLVDDCISHKKTIEEPEQILHSSNRNLQITKAVLLVSEEATNYVDTYYKVLYDYPLVAEWELIHRPWENIAVDMDGVICEDCPSYIDNNEKRYREWLTSARPYLIPTYKIDYIISCRLEKYRPETEEWLKRHEVQYGQLILWDIASKDDRSGKFAEHKIDVLLKIKPVVYWESSYHQAKKIWESTRIPTICIDEMIAFGSLNRR